MMQLPELREQRGVKRDTLKAIINKAAAEKRDLSDRREAAFDAVKVEIEKIDRDIANAEVAADASGGWKANRSQTPTAGLRPSAVNFVCSVPSQARYPT